jgi:hypothetical protein
MSSSDDDSNGEAMLLLVLDVERGMDEAAGAIMDHEIRRARRAAAPL